MATNEDQVTLAMSRLKAKRKQVSPENAPLVNKLKLINFANKQECIEKLESRSNSSKPDLELEKYLIELKNALHVLIADRDERKEFEQTIDSFLERQHSYTTQKSDLKAKEDLKKKQNEEKVKNISMVVKTMKLAQKTQLLFVLDCTGSMQPQIESIKTQIKTVVQDISKHFPYAKIEIGCIGYRDHCDEERIIKYQFSTDYDLFERFLDGIKATGGGDAAEDVFGGLDEAIHLEWSAPTRVLYHTADAPCHGTRFHNLGKSGDNDFDKNNCDRNKISIEQIFKSLKEKNILYYFGKMNESTDKMIEEFRKVSMDEYPKPFDAYNPSDLFYSVFRSLHESISKSVDKANYDNTKVNKGARSSGLDERYPDWKKIEFVEGNVMAYKLPKITSPDVLKRDFVWDLKTCNYRIHSKPFAQGGQRLAYHAMQYPNKEVVLKQFIKTGYDQDSQDCYMKTMETTTMAQLMATEFNKISPKHLCKPIKYLDVGVLQIAVKDDPVFYNLEDYMPTYDSSFTKWNSNAGFCNEIDYSQTMDAFSHWTYHISKKYLMVVDLQGLAGETEFLLTDPAIHCTDTDRFGDTNLASEGMNLYLTRHNCNKVCEVLQISEVN